MLITDYAVIKLKRDERRQWIILGQTNDLPGGVRTASIYPIVGMIDEKTGQINRIPRSHASGFLDRHEQYAYVYLRFYKRVFDSVVHAVDAVRVEVQRVRK